MCNTIIYEPRAGIKSSHTREACVASFSRWLPTVPQGTLSEAKDQPRVSEAAKPSCQRVHYVPRLYSLDPGQTETPVTGPPFP